MQWSATQSVLLRESKGVDFYNIEKRTRGDAYKSRLLQRENPEGKRSYLIFEFEFRKLICILGYFRIDVPSYGSIRH